LGAALRWKLVCAAAAAAAVDKSIGNAAVPLCLCLLDSLFFFFFYLLFYLFIHQFNSPSPKIPFASFDLGHIERVWDHIFRGGG